MPVYFAQAGAAGPVKIGFARSPNRRLSMLQTGNPLPLRFIRLIEGGREEEAAAHQQFASARLHGEWFTFCEGMLAFGSEIASVDVPSRRRIIVRFHPIVEELIDSGRYSCAAVSQWRKRQAAPYRVCCHAVAIADERGMPFAGDLAIYREPIHPCAA